MANDKQASKYWRKVDEDRNCTRCGEYVPPRTETLEWHQCPPGFWMTKRTKFTASHDSAGYEGAREIR